MRKYTTKKDLSNLIEFIIIDFLVFSEKYLLSCMIGAIIITVYCHSISKYIDRKVKRMVNKVTVRQRFVSTITLLIFFTYLFMLICIVFLSREPGSRDAFRVELLCIISKDTWARGYAIENIVLFIPLGFLLPRIVSRCNSLRWCMLAGVLSSVAIEVLQYITKMGYCELDDVLNNTIGTMIGYGVLFAMRTIIDKSKISRQISGIK